MLGRTTEETIWAEDIYEIQKFYLLGVATDQLLAIPIGNNVIIGRITEEKSVVSLVTAKKEGDKYVGKVLYKEFGKN